MGLPTKVLHRPLLRPWLDLKPMEEETSTAAVEEDPPPAGAEEGVAGSGKSPP